MNTKINNIDDFVNQYESFVKEWFLFKNQQNFTHVEKEDFWSELLVKIVEEDLLNKFDPDHYSKASFETWLKRVLNNLYIDISRKIARTKWDPIISKDDDNEEDGNITISEERFYVDRDIFEKYDIDKDIIKILIEKIPKIKDRVLVKLKTYIDGYTIITDEEYKYLEGISDLTDVKAFISDNIHNNKCGMKDKDISYLMEINKGSVNTTYQRIVSKYLIEPYKIHKAKNG